MPCAENRITKQGWLLRQVPSSNVRRRDKK